MKQLFEDIIFIDLPDTIQIVQPYVFFLRWWIIILVITIFLKISKLWPHAKEGIISALSILIMYVVYVLLHIYNPLGLGEYQIPLPFAELQENTLLLKAFALNADGKINIPDFITQAGLLYLLSFLVNQIYNHKPNNLKLLGWLGYRFFSTMICIGVYYAVIKVFGKVIAMIPAESYWQQAPKHLSTLFFGALLFLFILGSIKAILKHIFKVVNLAFDGLYNFFYTDNFGKILTRAIFTTLILTLFAYNLQVMCNEHFDTAAIPLTALTPGYAISLLGLLALWILVGYIL